MIGPCLHARAGVMLRSYLALREMTHALGDEVYLQLLRQLTHNPSKRSEVLGWKLRLLLCQHVVPSDRLFECVREFLLVAVMQDGRLEETPMLARQCISDLKAVMAKQWVVEGDTEQLPVRVLLIDNSTRKLHVQQSSTIGDVRDKVAEQLRILQVRDFSLFQQTDGLETHRLLPDSVMIEKLFQTWQTLKQLTGRSSTLRCKRRFLCPIETLHAGEHMHAMLTYHRALRIDMQYPMSGEMGAFRQIATSRLCIEHVIEIGSITVRGVIEPGLLERFVPRRMFLQCAREELAALIVDEAQEVKQLCNFVATRTCELRGHNIRHSVDPHRQISVANAAGT